MSYHEVRDPRTGRLLFRFDAEKDRIAIKSRQTKGEQEVDLAPYRKPVDEKDPKRVG